LGGFRPQKGLEYLFPIYDDFSWGNHLPMTGDGDLAKKVKGRDRKGYKTNYDVGQ
jgi:hypothetical protein